MMSRSGYTDDCDNLALYRGAVASAIRGKRGQKLLADLLAALDEMPKKELVRGEFRSPESGEVCALGACGVRRGIALDDLGSEEDGVDYDALARRFNVGECLAREVMYVNDEEGRSDETPAQRWDRVRRWVKENLRERPSA